jgi:hypothetical protein
VGKWATSVAESRKTGVSRIVPVYGMVCAIILRGVNSLCRWSL